MTEPKNETDKAGAAEAGAGHSCSPALPADGDVFSLVPGECDSFACPVCGVPTEDDGYCLRDGWVPFPPCEGCGATIVAHHAGCWVSGVRSDGLAPPLV